MAMGAGAGSLDMHGPVNAWGNLAGPWRMPYRSTTLFASGRCSSLVSIFSIRGGLARLAVLVAWLEAALVKAFVLGSQAVDFCALFTQCLFQSGDFRCHLIADAPMFVLAGLGAMVLAEDPGGGKPLQVGAMVAIRADEVLRCLPESGHQD